MNNYDIESVSEKLIECITDLLDTFNCEYTDGVKYVSFPCPIHGGDNKNGSSILKRDIGNWQCHTANCHEEYGSSIIHFVQALLTVKNERKYSFSEALTWAANFVGEGTYENNDPEYKQKTSFIQLCKYINRKKKNAKPNYTPRNLVKCDLSIPAVYYIKRGYSREILSKFDIGYCNNKSKSYYDRIVTPFYDDDGDYMIGYSSRSRYEKCDKCNLYHNPNIRCPITKKERIASVKWKHSSSVYLEDYLYNYWNAKKHIMKTGRVILVEGPGDVWRFEEAGIFNSVALLGAKLSPGQKYVLETSGAIDVIVATDNDPAGEKAFRSINEQCKKIFNIERLKYSANDPGSLTIEQIKELGV